MIQLQRIDFHDGLQCPGICIKRFINESVKVCDIHILQCFYDLSCRKVCPISVKLYFQQTVDQQCCITEREVSDNSLFQAVIIGPAYKIVFCYPEAFLYSVPFGTDIQYLLYRFVINIGHNNIIAVIFFFFPDLFFIQNIALFCCCLPFDKPSHIIRTFFDRFGITRFQKLFCPLDLSCSDFSLVFVAL